MRELLEKQRNYFATGETRPVAWRLGKLKQLKKAVVTYEEHIARAMWEDLHKSAYETYLTEISLVIQELNVHIRHLKRWARPERVVTPLHLFGAKSRIVKEPLGVVLIVAPWNYPFQLLFSPLVGAVAAGNCVVLKPSPYTPRVARVMAELIASVFAPAHVTLIEGGREVNERLWAECFDHIFFTGSPELGKVVLKAAARFLTPVTLELGGKSPCVVDRDADLDLAARRIVWGKCLNAGQTCIAPDYLWIHTEVKQALLERIICYIRHFYGEHPLESKDYPRIVRAEAFNRLVGLMKQGHLLFGGETDREKLSIGPTLIDGVSDSDSLMQQEIFGPLLPVLEFREIGEVVRYIDAHEKPLALYFFGTRAVARQLIARTSSGGVCVNDTIMQVANGNLPFGGVGNSGMGRYHGKDSFLTFSNRRSVLYAATCWDIPLRYPPYKALNLLKKMPGFH